MSEAVLEFVIELIGAIFEGISDMRKAAEKKQQLDDKRHAERTQIPGRIFKDRG